MESNASARPPHLPDVASPGAKQRGWTRWRLPLLVLAAGWALSALVFVKAQRDAVARQQSFFDERVAEAQAAIRVRMNIYIDALRGGTSFFAASKSVDREEWRVYAESLQLKTRYPGINGLGVILAVPPDALAAWQIRARVAGEPVPIVSPFPGTQANPADTTQYLITYVEGNVTDKAPTGRNIATEPSRRRAAELARDTGEPQIHHRIPGSRDTQRRSGLLLYLPLYRKNARLDTVADRRAAHLGWVYAQVYPDVFLEGVLGPMAKTLQLHFFEAGGLTASGLLYRSETGPDGRLPVFERVTEMPMAGQTFQLGWRRGPSFPPAEIRPARWLGGSLGFATLLLAGLVASLQSVGRRANAIATARTAELAVSEERFRQAFEFAGIGMALVALDGRFMRVNQSLCDIVGYSADELRRKTFQDITHPEDLGADLALLQELIKGQRRSYQLEKRYFHRDGHTVWIRLTATLARDASGAPLYGIAQIEDVTERKRLEENLAGARDQALEASRLKSEFLATMSHEIRTPMNAVLGMTALLRDTTLTPVQADYLRTIESSGSSLLTILTDILDYSKIEAGAVELEKIPFVPRRCVEEVVELFHGRAREKGIRLECTFGERVPPHVLGDAARVRQILLNLIGNAVKFTDAGEVHVQVEAEPLDTAGTRQRLSFAVRDTGIGIPPERTDRLFKSFSQVDASTTRRFGGTGLGLAISKRLVGLMGGTMWADSVPGEGSTFHFNIVVERAVAPVEEPVRPAVPLEDGLLADRHPLRVLIAEDNPVNQRVATLLLQRLGYQATAVSNGVEVLGALQHAEYDAILMDIDMPELDGCAATARIRASRGTLQQPWIIALTASAMQQDRERALAAGMNDFLTKPVRAEALVVALVRAAAAAREVAGNK